MSHAISFSIVYICIQVYDKISESMFPKWVPNEDPHMYNTYLHTTLHMYIIYGTARRKKHQRKGGKHKEENKNVEKQKKAAKELNNTAQQHKRYLSTIFCRCVNVFRWG